MARHRSAHPAIQLFPFLAVLVSVMGALIFLLLVTSKRIPQVAIARARAVQAITTKPHEAESAPPILSIPHFPADTIAPTEAEAPLPLAALEPQGPSPAELRAQAREAARDAERASLIDQWRQRIQSLQQDRDQFAANVQRQTLLTTAAERKQLQMLAELQELERKLGSLTGRVSLGSMQAGNADKERLQLEQRILGLRRQIKAVSEQQRADAGKYSIVPYDGKSGTTRRPILVECTATGFRFVPEDVFIGAGDIEGFSERQNPLLAGAMALTQYWNQVNQQQGTVAPDNQPYVLLIVRPSGTLGYYVSVRLLAALKQQHGYELVADDVELKWPAVDVGAQAACRAAVEGLLANRGAFASSTGGENGLSGAIDASGSLGRGDPIGIGPGEGNTVPGPGGRPTIRGGNGAAGPPLGHGPPRQNGPAGGAPKSFELTDLEPTSEEIGNRSWEDPSRFGGREHRRDRMQGTSSAGGVPVGKPPNEGAVAVDSKAPPAAWAPTGSPAKPTVASKEPAGSPSTGKPTTRPAVETADAPATSEGNRENPTETPPRIIPRPRPTPTRPAGTSSGRPRPSGSPPDTEQRLARGPRRGNGQEIPYEQLQRRRWGLFEEGANIGVEKSVTIRVDAEQMVVANQLIIPIHPGATRNDLFDHLLSAVDEHASSWGPAAAGFFWIPSLKFVISPGGNQIYDRLAPLVTRSGLRADAEFTLDKPGTPGEGGQP